MTENWIDVAASEDCSDEAGIEVVAGAEIIAIFRVDGELYAIDGVCAHQGGPVAQGKIEHGCVTCPWHGWQYEIPTGIQTINRKPLQKTFPARERDGRIEVQVG